MTKAELRNMCKAAGLNDEAMKKLEAEYDIEKMTKTVESAHTPKEAMEALHKLYPSLDVKEMQEQYEFYEAQSRELSKGKKEKKLSKPMELTTDELEHVAGGAPSWISKNWKKLVIGIAAALCAVLIGTGIGAGLGAAAGTGIIGGLGVKGIVFTAMGAIGAGVSGGMFAPKDDAALTDSSANWTQNF